MAELRRPRVPVAIRRAVADTEVFRRVVIRGLQEGARLRRPRVSERILVNSFPKAGTHLVARALDLSQIVRYSWQHLAPRELPDQSDEHSHQAALRTVERLDRVPNGQYATAHLSYDASLATALTNSRMELVVVVRDPRALLVSNMRYVMARRRHFLHRRFSELYENDEHRLSALLDGFSTSERWGLGRAPFSDLLAAFVPWRERATVNLRFEDLAGARAGGTREAQMKALSELYSIIPTTDRLELCFRVADEVWSEQSITFRSGQIHEWRTGLPDPLLREVESRLAPIARSLGYDFH